VDSAAAGGVVGGLITAGSIAGGALRFWKKAIRAFSSAKLIVTWITVLVLSGGGV
jgi:hypothetical protein